MNLQMIKYINTKDFYNLINLHQLYYYVNYDDYLPYIEHSNNTDNVITILLSNYYELWNRQKLLDDNCYKTLNSSFLKKNFQMTTKLFLSDWFLKLQKKKFPLKNLKNGDTYILKCYNKKQSNYSVYHNKKCTLINIKNEIATLELNNGTKLYLCINTGFNYTEYTKKFDELNDLKVKYFGH